MAQVSRAAFASSLATKINDNTAGDISAADVREMLTDLEDSVTWHDEITAASVETAIEAITLTAVTGATGDEVLIVDATDGGLKAVLWQNLPTGAGDAWGDAVDADIVPDADGTRDLGSATNRFASLHVDSIDLNGSTVTATATKTAPTGDVVGTTDTQTLTNKTLTSPKASYTSHNAGTKSTGTYTPAYTDGNMQYAVNGGAHTLAPQTGDGVIIIHYTNNGSAGTITTSGFTAVKGDSLTTTNAHEFVLTSVVINGNSVLTIQALQ